MYTFISFNSASAALLGAIIGGAIGVLGTIISTWATYKREAKSFERTNLQRHIDDGLSAYSFALNVIFNLKSGGSPDRATYGHVYARLSLYGSTEVKRMLSEIILLPNDIRKEIDTEKLITAMLKHIEVLKKNFD